MDNSFRLVVAQLNPKAGDLEGNAKKVRLAFQEAKEMNANLVAFPEMFLIGYQVGDLVRKPAFVTEVMKLVDILALEFESGPSVGLGAPYWDGEKLFNAYYILANGKIETIIKKHFLPNDNEFDEKRYFSEGPISGPYNVDGVRIGSPICEDAWHQDVCEAQVESGAEIFVVPNGSPYWRDKREERLQAMIARVIETDIPLVYLNMVGGQDDQGFDGMSFALNPKGELAMQMPAYDEVIQKLDFKKIDGKWFAEKCILEKIPQQLELDYRTMVETLKDYVSKTGFKKVLLGLSGGIDSALVAVIAVDALGSENVRCVMLPSEYTSKSSLEDASKIAKNLKCTLNNVPISEPQSGVKNVLSDLFKGLDPDTTEENIQSRLRALLLMAMSNKFGEMLLTTGNKSEVAVGYATIYGDMSGGYNPLKDLYKTRVFEISKWRNSNHHSWMRGPNTELINNSVLSKAPSAELRDNQKDEDSLPDYDILDSILKGFIDDDKSVAEIVNMGFDRQIVKEIEHLIYISEYKRYQSAPGTKLSRRAFWLDRRYPIVNQWRDKS
ncbi:NAD+ synthase [Rhodobacteraceae bacterium]|nr:NAD+ synthase [Paracoccaceae bacterium]MDC1254749.1 NAD+ synthase [Paracoccaceae bacterium]